MSIAWSAWSYQLVGPSSMNNQWFSIVAMNRPDDSKQNFYLMIQDRLTRRLGVVVRHENLEQTVYDLTIAKGGLKMHTAEPPPAAGPLLGTDGNPVKFTRDKDGSLRLPPGRPAMFDAVVGNNLRLIYRMQGMAEVARSQEGARGQCVIRRASGISTTTSWNTFPISAWLSSMPWCSSSV